MLLARDFVAHMATEVVKRLVEGGQIETKLPPRWPTASASACWKSLRSRTASTRKCGKILIDHQDEMRGPASHIRRCIKSEATVGQRP